MTPATPAISADDVNSRARPRDAENTRRLLLQSARRRFARDGYAAATVREIAADVGVNVALINRYFDSKEGLFEACLQRAVEDLKPDRSSTTIDQVIEAMLQHVTGLDTDKALQLLLLLRSSGDERADGIRLVTLRDYARRLARAAGWRPHDADSAATLLRAELAVAAGMGVIALRTSTTLEPLASATIDDLRVPLGDALRALLAPVA